MKQCNVEVGKVYILDDGEEVCIEHLCGVLYASYVDEYDKSVLIHTDRIVKLNFYERFYDIGYSLDFSCINFLILL